VSVTVIWLSPRELGPDGPRTQRETTVRRVGVGAHARLPSAAPRDLGPPPPVGGSALAGLRTRGHDRVHAPDHLL